MISLPSVRSDTARRNRHFRSPTLSSAKPVPSSDRRILYASDITLLDNTDPAAPLLLIIPTVWTALEVLDLSIFCGSGTEQRPVTRHLKKG